MEQDLAEFDPSQVGLLLETHRAALQLHCYRMTGSVHDAEDLVQETLLRAWRGYDSFQGKSSLRTWLYRIATNVCLDALKKRQPRRLLRPDGPAADPSAPVAAPNSEVLWLEPYPDSELPTAEDTPEEAALRHERISLAFMEILQLLPPRQRAILILSDILDWPSPEVANSLGTSISAVESGLHRARATISKARQPSSAGDSISIVGDHRLEALLEQYVAAWEANDLQGLAALLHEDIVLSMPPFPSWYQGRDGVCAILAAHPMGGRRRAGWRLVPTQANGQPAFILYRADHPGEAFRSFGLMVLTIRPSAASALVSALTIFKDTAIVERFGYPPSV